MGTDSKILFQQRQNNGKCEQILALYLSKDGHSTIYNFIDDIFEVVNSYDEFAECIMEYLDKIRQQHKAFILVPVKTCMDQDVNYVVTYDVDIKKIFISINGYEEASLDELRNKYNEHQ